VDHEHSRALPASHDQVRAVVADFLATVLPQDLQQLPDLDRPHEPTSL